MEFLTVKKMRPDHTLDFAAEELKKYLRMMMPERSEIPIFLEPGAKDGFRLGLLEDFGLPFEGKDPELDDVVHIDTDGEGGILAGSNPRSVLYAVYRFLRLNGCRFLFPGPDGEFIPHQPIQPQKYHKLADYRYRGHTTEGDPSFEHILDYIDFFAKQELNMYGLYGLYTYHHRYYDHNTNAVNRPPEPVTPDFCLQWKGRFEAELNKRGILIADGTHDFMMMALGLDPGDRQAVKEGKIRLTEKQISQLAMIGGKRGLFKNDPFYTNACMSNVEWRRNYVKTVTDYVEANPQIFAFGASLADSHHNFCECPECQKVGTPGDFQVLILNELDEELERRGLKAHLSMSIYVDKMFPPVHEKLRHPERFVLSFPPITRRYSSGLKKDSVIPPAKPYLLNAWEPPKSMEECVSYLKAWQEATGHKLPCRIYEYHFWRAQMRDPGLMNISRLIYDDTVVLKDFEIAGDMEDGSNRHYFPHGFHCHIYAETLVDRNVDYEAEKEDYFSHLYGKDWKEAVSVLQKISDAFGQKYMEGECGTPERTHYCPEHARDLEEVAELAARERALAAERMAMPTRPQTVAWRMLVRHAEYVEGLAKVLLEKCQGRDKLAMELFNEFAVSFGKHEYELERYMDLGLAIRALRIIVKKLVAIEY